MLRRCFASTSEWTGPARGVVADAVYATENLCRRFWKTRRPCEGSDRMQRRAEEPSRANTRRSSRRRRRYSALSQASSPQHRYSSFELNFTKRLHFCSRGPLQSLDVLLGPVSASTSTSEIAFHHSKCLYHRLPELKQSARRPPWPNVPSTARYSNTRPEPCAKSSEPAA